MDAYSQRPRYPRPPPPQADPFHAPPPPPHQSPYYPPPQHWAPPQDHVTSYHQPPPHAYSVHHPPPNHYPPPPPPPPQQQQQHWAPPPQSYYPQAHRGYSNANWGHHQVQQNEEDWAAKVKAWVDAKAATDSQHPQSQISGPPEEQSHYPVHHAQVGDFHYSESQHQQFPAPSYQQFPGAHSHASPAPHHMESASVSSSSYDGRQPYTVANGTFPGDAVHNVQGNFQVKSSSLYQQEVPSSYSSVTGKSEPVDKIAQSYESQPLPAFSAQVEQHHLQQTLPSVPFGYGNYSSDVTANIADQPLHFSNKYSHDNDPSIHINYGHHNSLGPGGGVESVAAMPPAQSWAPPDAVYSSIPPAQQHDPSVAMTSSIPGHVAPPFGSFPGASFQSSIPSASFPLGSAPGIHATTAFPGDVYGISSAPERPKKASVPNWLREEIIKKKTVISNSLEQSKIETQSIEDEDADKSIGMSIGKFDQADSRSVDSPRYTEEDDDEDSIEVARTAAINHEIKRILTEVLLKVTDELFDEIATKVLSEDDPAVDVGHGTATSKDISSQSPPVTAFRASAKVLIPEKIRESETGSVSGKSNSSAPGNVLGLANYTSDEEEDDEIQSSNLPNSGKDSFNESLSLTESNKRAPDYNSKYNEEEEEYIKGETNSESDTQRNKMLNSKDSSKDAPKESDNENNVDDEKETNYGNSPLPKSHESKYPLEKSEMSAGRVGNKNEVDADLQCKDARSEENNQKVGRHSSGKNLVKEAEIDKIQAGKKRDENSRRADERYDRKEKGDYRNGLKEKKDQIVQTENKAKESESRKRSSHPDITRDRKETEKDRSSTRKDHSKKRERDKYREDDRSGHRNSRDASQHKKRRSSSIESRGRRKKEISNNRANASSDETSDDSRRKSRSRRRDLSPSPVGSRRRRVSRSPHSKHNQHRHSPYSSLDTSRGRNSRSKSPKRRHK